jgi:hypothetical protein
MGRSSNKDKAKRPLSASKQASFHPLLVAARKTKLASAVSEAASECDTSALRSDISVFGNDDVLRIAAAAGVRDEHVVVTPCILRKRPSVLGYYRLLVGLSKKQFYHGSSGFGLLEVMEEGNTLTSRHDGRLDEVCRALNGLIADLIAPLEGHFAKDDIHDLPLLQLGAQLDGANRVKIGEVASQEVFSAIGGLLRKHVKQATAKKLELVDATGVKVTIVCSSDPDIEIRRDDGSNRPRRIAIEIKGGTDLSNAHNRAGEAEKSHIKAKKVGVTDFWTVASLPPRELESFKAQSPTTSIWFDLAEVLGRRGKTWEEFRRQVSSAVGVKLQSR